MQGKLVRKKIVSEIKYELQDIIKQIKHHAHLDQLCADIENAFNEQEQESWVSEMEDL
jgi:hypothetical protein